MREEPSSPVSALTVIALELRNANAQGKAPATSALNAILSSLGEKEGMPSTAASAQDLSLKVKRLCASQKRLLAFLEERSRSSLAPAKTLVDLESETDENAPSWKQRALAAEAEVRRLKDLFAQAARS
jgi:hypothetical protein